MTPQLRARFVGKFARVARERIVRALEGLGTPPDPANAHNELHCLAGEAAMLGMKDLADAARAAAGTARQWMDTTEPAARGECARLIRTTARILDAELQTADAQPQQPQAPRERNPGGPTQVLLIDDSEVVRAELSDYLTAMGVAVLTAENSSEAIAQARNAVVDLVLLDVNMPGTSTVTMCAALRGLIGSAPLLLLSSATDNELADAVRTTGASGSIPKRGGPEAVFAGIRAALASSA